MSDTLGLREAFATYWDDMDRCRVAKAYWSLLHVTVCMPDICAALQAPNGETDSGRYIAWCDEYLEDPMLAGKARYRMRCKVLHQGRSTTDRGRRYTGPYAGFAFGQPSSDGVIDHKRVDDDRILHLDVGELASEMKLGVESWIATLEADAGGEEAQNAVENLPTLVRVSVSVVVKVPTVVVGSRQTTGSVEITTILKTS